MDEAKLTAALVRVALRATEQFRESALAAENMARRDLPAEEIFPVEMRAHRALAISEFAIALKTALQEPEEEQPPCPSTQ